MSVEYEAFVGRGFMFGEDNIPSFKEYCERAKIDPNEAFEILQEDDLVISDCYSANWMDNIFFGYRMYTIDMDTCFNAKRLNCFEIDVNKEHEMEKKFNEVFGEYPPIFGSYIVGRAH